MLDILIDFDGEFFVKGFHDRPRIDEAAIIWTAADIVLQRGQTSEVFKTSEVSRISPTA